MHILVLTLWMFARVHQKSHPHMKKFFEMLLNCGWRFSDDSLHSGYWGSFCSQVCFGCVGKCAKWEQWYSMGWALLQSQQQIRRGELTCSPSRTHFLQPAVLAKTTSGFFSLCSFSVELWSSFHLIAFGSVCYYSLQSWKSNLAASLETV